MLGSLMKQHSIIHLNFHGTEHAMATSQFFFFIQNLTHHVSITIITIMLQENPFDVDKAKLTEPTVYWIPNLHLTAQDLQVLVDGQWLSTSHISAVNILLRKQFPAQSGLQDTLEMSKKLQWRSSSTDFVQIIHVSNNIHYYYYYNCLLAYIVYSQSTDWCSDVQPLKSSSITLMHLCM